MRKRNGVEGRGGEGGNIRMVPVTVIEKFWPFTGGSGTRVTELITNLSAEVPANNINKSKREERKENKKRLGGGVVRGGEEEDIPQLVHMSPRAAETKKRRAMMMSDFILL